MSLVKAVALAQPHILQPLVMVRGKAIVVAVVAIAANLASRDLSNQQVSFLKLLVTVLAPAVIMLVIACKVFVQAVIKLFAVHALVMHLHVTAAVFVVACQVVLKLSVKD